MLAPNGSPSLPICRSHPSAADLKKKVFCGAREGDDLQLLCVRHRQCVSHTLASLSCAIDAHHRSSKCPEEKKIASSSEQHGCDLQIRYKMMHCCMDCTMVHCLSRIFNSRKYVRKWPPVSSRKSVQIGREMVFAKLFVKMEWFMFSLS